MKEEKHGKKKEKKLKRKLEKKAEASEESQDSDSVNSSEFTTIKDLPKLNLDKDGRTGAKKHKLKKQKFNSNDLVQTVVQMDLLSREREAVESHETCGEAAGAQSDYAFFKRILGTIPPTALGPQNVDQESDEEDSSEGGNC